MKKKTLKYLTFLFSCILLIFSVKCNSNAGILTNFIVEKDGTEVRTVKYATRDDVSKFVVLFSLIYESFKFDFYDKAKAFCKSEDKNVPYEYLWQLLWSKYMFQKGQSESEMQRAKFLAHLILNNCVKDRFMNVFWPTLKSSISGILGAVINSNGFTIEARKPKGKMWQDWKITDL